MGRCIKNLLYSLMAFVVVSSVSFIIEWQKSRIFSVVIAPGRGW